MRISRSRRPDFTRKAVSSAENGYYDLYEDWDLIDASFAAQYGIRLRAEMEMSWGEFSVLLAGLMPETPLGQVISTRSETDKEMLKHFTKDQHRIRRAWQSRRAGELAADPARAAAMTKSFQEMCKATFGGGR